MQRHKFDSQFKRDIVRIYHSRKYTCSDLADYVGVHESTIYKWVRKYGKNLKANFSTDSFNGIAAKKVCKLYQLNKYLEDNVICFKLEAYLIAERSVDINKVKKILLFFEV